jgi:uncharacterized protein YheU (UPF0270 family)
METVFLHGSEDVARAATTIRAAADDTLRASSEFSSAVHQHNMMMREFIIAIGTINGEEVTSLQQCIARLRQDLVNIQKGIVESESDRDTASSGE